ncbi:hypothetical protein CBER1_11935 [Cercospora berteroae]|uniref:Phospholipase A2 domain-containing protein n=1 Tax=Cercospora berteroae TaxID=357750 RepID=A0A2S6C0L4_9PEZI|nr:hypothetical protein CBER1_11935 [Cercospora berteroae]
MGLTRLLLLGSVQSFALATAHVCGAVGIYMTPPYFTSTSPTLTASVYETSSSSPWTLFEKECAAMDARTDPPVVPDTSCLIDPNSADSQFHILSLDLLWLMPTAELAPESLGALTLRLEGKDESNGSAFAPQKASKFFLQHQATAPAGLYDLILTGPGPERRYVAKAADGALVLTSASTRAIAQDVDGRSIVTSIFTVDCDGRIGVMDRGVHYNWNASPHDSRLEFTPAAHSSNSTMMAFDLDKFEDSRPHAELRRSIVKRDTTRCGPGQHAITKPNARPITVNGCGSVKNHAKVPELGFHVCCNAHDTCYDDCNEQSCDHCNDAFFTCMKHKCKQLNFLKVIPCFAAAVLYYKAVQGSFGCPYFKRYSDERCFCVND